MYRKMCYFMMAGGGLYTYSSVVKGREYQQIIKNWLLPVLKHKQGKTMSNKH